MEQPTQQPDPKAMQAYQRLGMAAQKIIYTPEIAQKLTALMKEAGDPAAAIAHAATLVIGMLRQQAKGINPEMVNIVAPVVISELFALGNAAGLFGDDTAIVQQAVELFKRGGAKAQAPQQAQQQAPQQAPAGLVGNAMQGA